MAIAATVVVANFVYLVGIRVGDPALYRSGLGAPEAGLIRGPYTIDGNDGWTAQALGHHAAQQLISGQLPLWNLHEGLGQPLLGEMQSAAMFLPFILLQLLPNGFFLMHVTLELVAGFSTLCLLRTLRLTWTASAIGGCLFAVNGVYAVMTNSPFNPVAFLPMALCGVELIVRAVREHRRPALGVWVTALAFGWMLLAGFPETAFLEGLYVGAWALVRLVQLRGQRRTFALWAAAAAAAGLVIGSPAVVAFVDFLHFGHVAYHDGSANAYAYDLSKITTLALPFLTGPLSNPIFGYQAGYVTLPALLVAAVGLASRPQRALKLTLAGITTTLILNMFGFPPANFLLGLIPGIASVLTYKYGLALIVMTVVVAVGFGIDDLQKGRVQPRVVLIAAAAVTVYFVASLLYATTQGLIDLPGWTSVVAVATGVACVAVMGLLLAARRFARRAGSFAVVIALLLGIDAAATYAVPQVAASRPASIDMAPVDYLRENLGTSRFFTLGPIMPNYGSYWDLSQLNANDLPVPQKYTDFIVGKLRPQPDELSDADIRRNFVDYQLIPFNPPPRVQRLILATYLARQEIYRDAGVRYLVTAPGVVHARTATEHDLIPVLTSAKAEIWLDAGARPYYTADPASCMIASQTLSEVTVDCASPATLTRRQLLTPGWRATINGATTELVDRPDQLFQAVTVPAGRSTVRFDYMPRYFLPAFVASVLLLELMLADLAYALGRRVGRRRSPGSRAAVASVAAANGSV